MTDTEKKATPIEIRNRKLAELLVKNFTNVGFDAHYVDTAAEAKELALSFIPDEAVVSWGGAWTADDIGLMEELRSGKYKVIDRDTAKSMDERNELMRQALLCDVFIAGPNAFSEDGQLVFIDGNGNRVAAISYGPHSVVLLASLNKYNKTLEGAVERARNYAAPVNGMRFIPMNKNPCGLTGSCAKCRGADSFCNFFLNVKNSRPAGRIKIIFIGETVGF